MPTICGHASGFRMLGAPEIRVKTLPDLRIATAKLPCPADLLTAIRAQIGPRPVWLAASTHPLDEDALLAAKKPVLAAHSEALLILAPRHPKRGNPPEAEAQGFNKARRSAGEDVTTNTQIYLADTIGELGAFFSLAPITFLGGSFGSEGGHNPYEPASFRNAILSGERVKNLADAYAALDQAGAAELLTDPAELGPALVSLMLPEQGASMGATGQALVEASENSVAETI